MLKLTGIQSEKSHRCLCVKFVPPILDHELEYGCTSLAGVPNLHLHITLLISFGRTIVQWFLGNSFSVLFLNYYLEFR